MENTIIVSIFTTSAGVLAKNHLLSLRAAGYTNTLSYCTDKKLCYVLNQAGFDSKYIEGVTPWYSKYYKFASKEFNQFSYIRYRIINELLDKYDYVWYLSVDTVVLGNIWDAVDITGNWDIQFADDCMLPCTGSILVKKTPEVKKFMQHLWEERNDKITGQMYLAKLIKNRNSDINVKIKTKSIFKFCPGVMYFPAQYLIPLPEEDMKMRDLMKENFMNKVKEDKMKKPILVHANYIVSLDSKIKALQKMGLWFIKD